METLRDNQLVQKTLYEDKEFFACLVNRYENKLRIYLKRITFFQEQDIEDMLQNIFIKAYQNLHDFDQRLSFSSWLYRIAHNESIDRIRRKHAKGRDSILDLNDEEVLFQTESRMHRNTTDLFFDKKYIKRALSFLKVDYREIITLYYFEGKSYREISDILKKPENTVATMLRRAKRALRKEINKITNYTYEN